MKAQKVCLTLRGETVFHKTCKFRIPNLCQVWEHFFSLLRQEYPPILTSGKMLSHPGGWDKPIPEVIHLWRHRTSTPNNLEKSFKTYFAHFWTRMRKIIKHHIEGGTLESHPRVKDLLHPRLGKPRRGLQILDTRKGFPRPSLNVVLDSINLASVCLCAHQSVWYM